MSLVTPIAVPTPALPLPDPASLGTWAARMAEMHRWMRENAAPGMNLLASHTLQNAQFAAQMADQAASVFGFRGFWDAQTGAATMPYSVVAEDPETGQDAFWVLMQNVPDVTAHTPGVSIVWALFNDAANAAATAYDDSVTALGVTNVQLAIEALLARINNRVSRTGTNGSAVMPFGTTAQRDGTPALGYKRWNTSLNQGRGAWETWNGVVWEQEGWVIGSTVETTGTEFDFVIPDWINEYELRCQAIRPATASVVLFRLGTAVNFETADYVSYGDGDSATSGFRLTNVGGTNRFIGVARFKRGLDNTWDYELSGSISTSGSNRNAAGYKSMSGPVTRARVTTVGTENFTSGFITPAWRK